MATEDTQCRTRKQDKKPTTVQRKDVGLQRKGPPVMGQKELNEYKEGLKTHQDKVWILIVQGIAFVDLGHDGGLAICR